ncbi:MAG: TolC family protein [Bacteroides sp.]
MEKRILVMIVAAACCCTARAQEAWGLRQCIDYAIEHNINIRQTRNQAEQNAVDVNTSKWTRLPSLNASAGQNWSWGRAASPVDNTYSDINSASTQFGLNASVPLFTGLQIPNQYALAKLNLQAAVEDLNKAKEDLAINVASSYLQVLFNVEISKVAAAQVVLSQEQLARLTRLGELGKASPAQVAEAKARVAQDEMNAVQSDNSYRLALLDLSQLLELPTPEGFCVVSPDTALVFSPLTPPDEIYTEAVLGKPDIRAAQLRLEGSEKNIRIAQSAFYPQLSLGGGLGSNYYTMKGVSAEAFGTQLKNNLNKYVGFNLNIPLFNRFSTRNRVRTARLHQSSLALQLDNTKKTLYKEIQQAWYSAVAAQSKYTSSLSAVDANEESFRLMSEKFTNGKATAVEYNEAKQNLLKALSDKIQAKYDYLFRVKILDFYKGRMIS